MFRNPLSVGVDIGSHSIKAVALQQKKDQFELAAYAEVELTKSVINEQHNVNATALLSAIRQLKKQLPWQAQNVTLALSDSAVISKVVQLDTSLNEDEAEFAIVQALGAGAGAASIAFQVAKLGNILLDLELSALQTENKAEIISSPRLMTTNKKTAYIEQGTEIPYLEASSSGATSVSFKKAVLSLMVTPQITPDDKLVLDLEVTQDNKGEDVPTGTGTAISIDTQRIGTQVLVNNGETVVLGGIYQHSMTHVTRKVPLLGDIPILGALFRHKMEQMGKRELLIFVTPKIVIQ